MGKGRSKAGGITDANVTRTQIIDERAGQRFPFVMGYSYNGMTGRQEASRSWATIVNERPEGVTDSMYIGTYDVDGDGYEVYKNRISRNGYIAVKARK